MYDLNEFYTKYRNGLELTVYNCGYEECTPNKEIGPSKRDFYLLHYIYEGEGSYFVNGKSYRLKAHDGFVIFPNVESCYEPSPINPWKYTWVGFDGIKSEEYLNEANVTKNNPIFHYDDEEKFRAYFRKMEECENIFKTDELRLRGYFYLIISEIAECSQNINYLRMDPKNTYIVKALKYIEKNYYLPVSINDIAKYLNINSNYLSGLFNEKMGTSPKQFLINYRIKKAQLLLKDTDLPVSTVSRYVGFDDPLAFSKVFKKRTGDSPTGFRNNKQGSSKK